MANVRIDQLTQLSNPSGSDVLPIVRVSDNETKKVTLADLLKNAGSGDAAAPGVAFDEDSDTGMYRSGPNTLGFTTGGVGRFFIDSSGNISIGLNDQIGLNSDGTTEYLAPIATGITASNVNTKASHSFFYPAQNVTGGEGVVLALGMEGRGRVYLAAEHPGTSKDSVNFSIYAGSGTVNKSARFGSDGGVEFYSYAIVNGYLCAEINTTGNGTLNLGSSNSRVRGPVIRLRSRDVPEVVPGTKNESVVIDAGKLGSSNDAAIHLKTGAGNTTIDRLVIKSSGTVEIPGSLTIGGTAAANTIDEYEEGSFNADMKIGTTQLGIAASDALCAYTRIGEIVIAQVNITIASSDINGATGSLSITGLPFVAKNTPTSNNFVAPTTITNWDTEYKDGSKSIVATGTANSSQLALYAGSRNSARLDESALNFSGGNCKLSTTVTFRIA